MTTQLDALINDISTLGLTKEASAATQPEDNLVSILQGISTSLVKKAEELPDMGDPVADGATEVAGAIVQNPEPIAAAVATAVADVLGSGAAEGSAPELAPEGADMNNDELAQKISFAVTRAVKEAVEGPTSYGLSGDASRSGAAGVGNVQAAAKAILDAKTSKNTVNDPEMVSAGGATDPMTGVVPTTEGGEQKPLQNGGLKAAMANLNDEDLSMMFKLASIGYDVSVETLSDEIHQEKVAQAQYAEKVARAQRAQQAQYAPQYAPNAAYARQVQAEKIAMQNYNQTLINAGYNPYSR